MQTQHSEDLTQPPPAPSPTRKPDLEQKRLPKSYLPLTLSAKHHIIYAQRIGNKMETEEAGIRVGGVERLETVAEFMLHCKRP